jgi:hypothetical protein
MYEYETKFDFDFDFIIKLIKKFNINRLLKPFK